MKWARSAWIGYICPKIRGGSTHPVMPFEDLESVYPPGEWEILFAVGYTQMGLVRKQRMKEAAARGYRIAGYRHPDSHVQAQHVGCGNIFFEQSSIGVGTEIGDGNIFSPMSYVAHDASIGSFNYFSPGSVVAGYVFIGDNCMLGANCTIRDGIEIRDGTLVGAGAYISRSTDAWGVYVPPRSVRLEGRSSLDASI